MMLIKRSPNRTETSEQLHHNNVDQPPPISLTSYVLVAMYFNRSALHFCAFTMSDLASELLEQPKWPPIADTSMVSFQWLKLAR